MEHVSTVFDLHPATKHVIGMRYNALDRGPFVAPHMTVHDEVGAFYEHARVLEGILRELELSIRLEPGDALLVDNHRVLHGRHIFPGNRAMVGCYMNRDDWLSRWRMLEARANAGSRQGKRIFECLPALVCDEYSRSVSSGWIEQKRLKKSSIY